MLEVVVVEEGAQTTGEAEVTGEAVAHSRRPEPPQAVEIITPGEVSQGAGTLVTPPEGPDTLQTLLLLAVITIIAGVRTVGSV